MIPCLENVRGDAVFFNKDIRKLCDANKVAFPGSVLFARFAELKEMIEVGKRRPIVDRMMSNFDARLKSKAWHKEYGYIYTL